MYVFAVVLKCYTEMSWYRTDTETFHSNRQTKMIFITLLNSKTRGKK